MRRRSSKQELWDVIDDLLCRVRLLEADMHFANEWATNHASRLNVHTRQLAALGVMGDILAAMRTLQQRTLERVRRVELRLGVEPSHYEPGARPTGHERTTGEPHGRPRVKLAKLADLLRIGHG